MCHRRRRLPAVAFQFFSLFSHWLCHRQAHHPPTKWCFSHTPIKPQRPRRAPTKSWRSHRTPTKPLSHKIDMFVIAVWYELICTQIVPTKPWRQEELMFLLGFCCCYSHWENPNLVFSRITMVVNSGDDENGKEGECLLSILVLGGKKKIKINEMSSLEIVVAASNCGCQQ